MGAASFHSGAIHALPIAPARRSLGRRLLRGVAPGGGPREEGRRVSSSAFGACSPAAEAARSRQKTQQALGLAALDLRVAVARERGDENGAERLERLSTWANDAMRKVPGFFEPGLLEPYALLDAAQRAHGVHGSIAEVGVYCGKSFIPLALLRRTNESALAIDCFEDQAANRDASGNGDRARFEAHLEAAHVRDAAVRELLFSGSAIAD